MTMTIGDEEYDVSPEAWQAFDDWYGDKSYRYAYVVAEIETAIRNQVVADLRVKAARDWPGIGLLLEDIVDVVERGPDGEPREG
ncbi:hypothetical protein [Streptomyces scopuliridis]|uniref:Uncharacterized protein n=1 Tax=Streptomyces scopuliridis TaxID=452529 RepID=A0ACD4ZRW7_9ACTN|nr:hypothetical protein [Streptomyces scopuliridis]WSC01253.1 hypothetical protein OG835_32480 [Streptomyces scopuliridis]